MQRKQYLIAILAVILVSSVMVGMNMARYGSIKHSITALYWDVSTTPEPGKVMQLAKAYANFLTQQGSLGSISRADYICEPDSEEGGVIRINICEQRSTASAWDLFWDGLMISQELDLPMPMVDKKEDLTLLGAETILPPPNRCPPPPVKYYTQEQLRKLQNEFRASLSMLSNSPYSGLNITPRESWDPKWESIGGASGKIKVNQDPSFIVIHHTGDFPSNLTAAQAASAIKKLHMNDRGYSDIAYHFVIDQYGKIAQGRVGGPMAQGAHFSDWNDDNIGIVLVGNFDNEKPSRLQLQAMERLIKAISTDLNITINGTSTVKGSPNCLRVQNVTFHGISGQDGHSTNCAGRNLIPYVQRIGSTGQLSIDTPSNNSWQTPSLLLNSLPQNYWDFDSNSCPFHK